MTQPTAEPAPTAANAPAGPRLLRNGDEAFPAFLAAIEGAQSEVLLEMYWFDSDATGALFADALCARARAGVEVSVIYDAIGSLDTDPALFARMTEAGVRVREFNPISPFKRRFRLAQVGIRDHRKILVVDGRVGFTGGLNLTDKAAAANKGGGGWRDYAVELTGAPAQELRALFFDTWQRLSGPRPRTPAPQRRNASALNRAAAEQAGVLGVPGPSAVDRAMDRLARNPKRTSMPMAPPEGIVRVRPEVQILGHSTWGAARTMRNLYERTIRGAKKRILLENAYFIPDARLLRALESAARRGVEVRVVVPRESDVPSVAWASRALYTRLLRAGVKIHEWLGPMLHAKVAVIDDWGTVGSYNLDYRSLRYQLEVSAATEEPAFVAALAQSIAEDFGRTEELTLERWAARPWWWRVVEFGHFLVRKLL